MTAEEDETATLCRWIVLILYTIKVLRKRFSQGHNRCIIDSMLRLNAAD